MIMIRLVNKLKRSSPRIGCVSIAELVLDNADGGDGRLHSQQQHQRRAEHGDPSR